MKKLICLVLALAMLAGISALAEPAPAETLFTPGVYEAKAQGFGGDVVVTVGIDGSGKVVGLSANVSTETSGVGSKAGLPAYTDKYIGLSGNANGVDKISGATYSSTAVRSGVNAALAAYDAIK